MGHMVSKPSRMFHCVTYGTKTTAEVRDAMSAKIELLRARVVERDERMKRVRNEYQIDAERLAILVMRYQEDTEFVSYDRQGAGDDETLIPAGVIRLQEPQATKPEARRAAGTNEQMAWHLGSVTKPSADRQPCARTGNDRFGT
ncbi:MAG: hypothetical protein AAGA48_33400 [Myxococcota bacterium]